MDVKVKDPDKKVDYYVDFAPLTNGRDNAESDWLVAGDTLTTHSVTVATGLTLATSGITNDSTVVTVWLEGGTTGQTYDVEVDVTTVGGRKGSKSFDVIVEDE